MTNWETIMPWLEIIGTIAFAVSGAGTGYQKGMDVFGVVIMGIVTAVGGGILRDVVLGNTPPLAFRDPVYLLAAAGTSVAVFVFVLRRPGGTENRLRRRLTLFNERLLLLADAVGLGAFTVSGIKVAYAHSYMDNPFLLLFVGVVTGVGGGVLRDLFAGETPQIFRKHFYATASMLGAAVTIALLAAAGGTAAYCGGLVTVIVLRMLAVRYRWHLPSAQTSA